MKRFSLIKLALWLLIISLWLWSLPKHILTFQVQAGFSPFGTITLSTDFDVNGAGSNIDTIAFWEAPNPNDSLMFVTSKNSKKVEVWKYPFQSSANEQNPITNCFDGNTNGVWVDQETDLLYISMRNTGTVCVFNLPSLTHAKTIDTSASSSEPNLALLNVSGGQKRLYVTSDSKVYIHDASSGSFIKQFSTQPVETAVADDLNQVVYIPDEKQKTGIHIYDPDGNKLTSFGQGPFDSDEEGILLYTCPSNGSSDNGEGLIVVSDQKANLTDYEFFNRKTKDYLGKLNLTGVSNTDGIASTQQSSTQYPMGVFAAIDNDTSTVGIGWDKIFNAANLSCPGGSGPTNTPAPTTPTSTPTPPTTASAKAILASYGTDSSPLDLHYDNLVNLLDLLSFY